MNAMLVMVGKDRVHRGQKAEHLTQSLWLRTSYPKFMVSKLSPEGCSL